MTSTNPELQGLIQELKKKSIEGNVSFWKKVAIDLEKPSRKRRIVNLTKLNKYAGNDVTLLVPGKVLGDGTLTQKVNIVAFTFSQSALDKIKESGSKALLIKDLLKEKTNHQHIKIIG